MARLTNEQVQEVIKKSKNGDNIRVAIKQERRLSFHTECLQEYSQLTKNQAFKDWLAWSKSLLPVDKHDKFEKLILLPLPTNKIVESIFTELAKVFEAQNSQKRAQMIDKTLEADADEWMERTGMSSFMATRAWNDLRIGLNGFVVIDLPVVQTTARPEPTIQFLPITQVHDVEINQKQVVEYIAFRIDGETMAVMDDEFYRVYKKDKGGQWNQVIINPHTIYGADGAVIDGLGYCPVQSVFPRSSGTAKYIDKQGPITNVLSDLDWYLFKEISYNYLSLYGDYPIMVTYKESCDYKNEQGHMCEGSKVAFEYILSTATPGLQATTGIRYDECPRCAGRKTVGPGTFWTIDPPRDNQDVDLMKDPIKIVEVSNDKLVFGETRLKNMRDDIFINCVGKNGEPDNNQAKNEKQVMSGFESRQSILESLKLVLETTEEFIWNTAFILRYGRTFFTGSIINYGNKFYLQTVEEVNERYVNAKKAGKPMYELAMLRDLANKTQNRHNHEEMSRIELLEQLEPWPDLSIEQVSGMGLAESDLINYFVKLNFNSYVSRFERENMNIVEFGSKASLQMKLDAINLKLQEYGKSQIESARALNPEPKGDTRKTEPRN